MKNYCSMLFTEHVRYCEECFFECDGSCFILEEKITDDIDCPLISLNKRQYQQIEEITKEEELIPKKYILNWIEKHEPGNIAQLLYEWEKEKEKYEKKDYFIGTTADDKR